LARTISFDLGDGGLLGLAEGGGVFGPSPGCALVLGEGLLLGGEALRRCRLSPRLVASDFWARLDTAPLGPPFPEGLSSADLVHAHLEHLWKKAKAGTDEVILAIPGVYDERQLGVLLGITHSLAMPVGGLVDAALAGASAGFRGERLIHVDLGLRRAVVTEIRQGASLVRERVALIDRWGLDEIHDAQMRGAAEAFVRRERFDPLHDAATEQQLFDRLPPLLAALARDGRTTLSLSTAGHEVAVDLTRTEAEEWTATFARELSQQVSLLKEPGEPTSVLVSSHAARLPGLVACLAAIRGVEVEMLSAQAAAVGGLRQRAAIRSPGGALRLVTRLPRPEGPKKAAVSEAAVIPPTPSEAVPAARSGRRPTHVLVDSVARAITSEPLVVGTAPAVGARGLRLEGEIAGVSRAHCRLFESGGASLVEDLSTFGTFLNGERVPGRAVLAKGDRIRVGSPGIELLLIEADED
jgi:hypothetical protein